MPAHRCKYRCEQAMPFLWRSVFPHFKHRHTHTLTHVTRIAPPPTTTRASVVCRRNARHKYLIKMPCSYAASSAQTPKAHAYHFDKYDCGACVCVCVYGRVCNKQMKSSSPFRFRRHSMWIVTGGIYWALSFLCWLRVCVWVFVHG